MRNSWRYTFAWLAISVFCGAIAKVVFGASFLLATVLVAIALISNGLLSGREDKGKFND